MQNLRDKLLKAGLVSQDQAKKADEDSKKKAAPRPPQTSAPRASPPSHPHSHSHARPPPREHHRDSHAPARKFEPPIPKLPPLPGSREHQRLVSKQQLEQDKKIRDIVTAAQVAVEPGDQTFYFVTRKQRLRRLDLSAAQHAQLEAGTLAVVERPDPGQIDHALVPAEVAETLLPLSDKTVRFLNKGEKKVGFLSDDEVKTHQAAEESGAAEAAEAAETQREDEATAKEIASEQQPSKEAAAEG